MNLRTAKHPELLLVGDVESRDGAANAEKDHHNGDHNRDAPDLSQRVGDILAWLHAASLDVALYLEDRIYVLILNSMCLTL